VNVVASHKDMVGKERFEPSWPCGQRIPSQRHTGTAAHTRQSAGRSKPPTPKQDALTRTQDTTGTAPLASLCRDVEHLPCLQCHTWDSRKRHDEPNDRRSPGSRCNASCGRIRHKTRRRKDECDTENTDRRGALAAEMQPLGNPRQRTAECRSHTSRCWPSEFT
jgi:hypothetical protein